MPNDPISFLMFTLALTPLLGFGLIVLTLHVELKSKKVPINTDNTTNK